MKLKRFFDVKIKFTALLTLFTTLFISNIAYANPASRASPFDGVFNAIYMIIYIVITLIILGLVSLFFMKLIRKIIIETQEIKNELLIRKTIHQSATKKRRTDENISDDL